VVDVMNTSGRSIIVEGVESLARLKLLRSTGAVDQVQGYIVSRPLPIDDLRAFLAGGWRAGPLSQLARSA
jgi:EAL domain-containing protein (putative c-di-GMP-specific phosphodiesterase class I)